jgi:cellulose synthase/poly-beta-1,6-N-acetylglucosamine synthase-like glycosyltransferase
MGASEMLLLFFLCLSVIVYVYFGYPLLLRAGALGKSKVFAAGTAQPGVSIIVPAHNEESHIEAKLINLLELDYPSQSAEILVGNDGSSDSTEDIVRRFAHRGVRLVSFPQQRGKSAIQNALVAAATRDILLFTDADCFCARDSLRRAVEHFNDQRVGLVTASPRYSNGGDTTVAQNESLYLRYEAWLRRVESERGLLAMASGSFFAMRRALWQPLPSEMGDDFVLPLRVAQARMITRLDQRLFVVTHLSQSDPKSMLKMKSRIIRKDLLGLLSHRSLLNPTRHGSLAIALWSHKLLRWLVPYFLIALILCNIALLGRPIFNAFFVLQCAFYGAALMGFISPRFSGRMASSVPMSFCVVNFAALVGTLALFGGRTTGKWKPHRAMPRDYACPTTPSSDHK